MYFDCMGRHLSICSVMDLPRMAQRDPKFWHVVSILETYRSTPTFDGFRDVIPLRFDDIEYLETEVSEVSGVVFPRQDDIEAAFGFADERWGEPLLIHCWAGLSRSTAMALSFLARGLYWDGVENFAKPAVELLLQIRPRARPNVLVLQLGLQTFLSDEEAIEATRRMAKHPVLLKNRGG